VLEQFGTILLAIVALKQAVLQINPDSAGVDNARLRMQFLYAASHNINPPTEQAGDDLLSLFNPLIFFQFPTTHNEQN
jgi:hypothetical protein